MGKIALIYLNNSVISYTQIHMGLASISTFLKIKGHQVRIFDTYYDSCKNIINIISSNHFDLVGITTTELHFKDSLTIANNIKKNRNVPIILGGVFPSLFPNECLKHKCIDMVCVGEGEYVLNDLLNKNEISLIQGVWGKQNRKIICNGVTKCFNVNEIGITNYKYFNNNAVISNRKFRDGFKRLVFTWSSRGCQYNCSYCCNYSIRKIQNNTIRYRKIYNLISEMKLLAREYVFDEFFFTDEDFLANKKHVIDFCEEYVKSNVKMPFGILSRPNHVNLGNLELIRLIKKAGCSRIHMGVEVGNEQSRMKFLRRNISNQQTKTAFQICKELKIKTRAFIIIGFYFENTEDIQKTYDFVVECGADEISCSIFYPLKGTELGNYYERNNLKDHSHHVSNYFDDCVICHPFISRRQFIVDPKIRTLC